MSNEITFYTIWIGLKYKSEIESIKNAQIIDVFADSIIQDLDNKHNCLNFLFFRKNNKVAVIPFKSIIKLEEH